MHNQNELCETDKSDGLKMKFRTEKDSMGAIDVPENAYYGPQTQRAVKNFPVSGLTLPSPFIRALALIKKYAALVNADLQLLDSKKAKVIAQAAQEVLDEKFDDQFVVDVFQTRSETATHMNIN